MRTSILSICLAVTLWLATAAAQAQEALPTTPIRDIQSHVVQGDDSAFVGQRVRVRGIVTGVYGNLFFVQEQGGGPWSGISAYRPGHMVVQGDEVVLTGTVGEFHDLTQIDPEGIEVLSSNNPLPRPQVLTTRTAQAEQWEGVLVRLENVEVTDRPDSYGEWRIRDADGTILVDDKGVFYKAEPGATIAAITAIVDHAFGSYRLIPRSLDDIAGSAVTTATPMLADMIPIYAIQGNGQSTPLERQRVDTYGVVTAVEQSGFFLQDPVGDGDATTSDGIYVYTERRPGVTVGRCVFVQSGAVSEYYAKTELSRANAVRPADVCPTTRIEPVPIPMARLNSDPAALFERYEGMLVAFPELRGMVQGPTVHFRSGEVEIGLVAEELLPYIDGRRVFQSQPGHTSALMYLSNKLGAELPDVAWGDRVAVGTAGDVVTAILDYNFGKYQLLLLPGQQVTGMAAHAVQGRAAPATGDDFTVCTFNVHGLGRGGEQYGDEQEYARQLRRRALVIAQALEGCTVVGIQETGTPQDAENLAAVLKDEFGLAYTAVAIAGPNSASLEFPLTNSLLARTDRVQVLGAELRQGCSRFSYGVRYQPGDCPRRQYALFNRPPLVVNLAVQGDWGDPYPLTVIVNHWKSKSGDEAVNVVRRTLQAEHVASLVQERLDADPEAQVVVLGDLNDYYASGPVKALRQGTTPSLIHLYDYIPPLDRYTYIFNGASQVLDHMLITPAMLPEFAGISPLHTNADYPITAEVDPGNVYGVSDHDAVLMRVRPGGAGWVGGDLRVPGIQVTLLDERGTVQVETVSDGLGHFRLWNIAPGVYTLRYATPEFVTLGQAEATVTVVAGVGNFYRPAVIHRTARLGANMALLAPGLAGADSTR